MLKRIVDTDDSYRKVSNDGSSREFFSLQDLAGHSYGEIIRFSVSRKHQKLKEVFYLLAGITSDPLTQFAVVFSSIIHDADHPGVTNSQLVDEGTQLAKKYKNKSVAEQNSVDKVWNILMDPLYSDLRQCLYTTEEELNRFRQVSVISKLCSKMRLTCKTPFSLWSTS